MRIYLKKPSLLLSDAPCNGKATVEEILSNIPTVWDNTMRGMLTCPAKLLMFLRGFDYVTTPEPLLFGRLWGRLLQLYLLHKKPDAALSALQTEEGEILFFDELADLLRQYDNYWKMSNLKFVKDEVGFTLPILMNSEPFFVGGSFDSVVTENGKTFIKEDKVTSSYLTDNYIKSYSFSPQLLTYYYAGVVGFDNFSGIILDLTTRKATKDSPKFIRKLISFTSEELRDFMLSFHLDMERARRIWKGGEFPKAYGSNCVKAFGGFGCQYMVFCESGLSINTVPPESFGFTYRKEKWGAWLR